MSFRNVVARMAVDPEFARYARENPNEVGRAYGLSTAEIGRLATLSDAQEGSAATALGVRLSRAGGMLTNAVASFAHTMPGGGGHGPELHLDNAPDNHDPGHLAVAGRAPIGFDHDDGGGEPAHVDLVESNAPQPLESQGIIIYDTPNPTAGHAILGPNTDQGGGHLNPGEIKVIHGFDPQPDPPGVPGEFAADSTYGEGWNHQAAVVEAGQVADHAADTRGYGVPDMQPSPHVESPPVDVNAIRNPNIAPINR